MKAETKPKTLHYRRATFLQGNNDLQTVLKKALTKRKNVGQRLEELTSEDHTHRFINRNRNQLGMLFGSLVVYAEGTNRPLVTIETEKTELDIEQIAPPMKGSKRREFLDSILYFGIKDNHVLLVQSPSLTSRQMEAHLFWFLHQAGVLSDEDGVSLNDYTPKATKSKIEKAHVKKVSIGTPLEADPVIDDEAHNRAGGAVEKVKRVRYTPHGLGFDFLKVALGDQWLNKLKLDEALDDSRLQVSLEISYSYSTTEKSQKLLDNIANSLRHVEQDDIRIQLKNKGVIHGKELRLSSKIDVRAYGGVLDESDLYPQMHNWLVESLEQGIIDP